MHIIVFKLMSVFDEDDKRLIKELIGEDKWDEIEKIFG